MIYTYTVENNFVKRDTISVKTITIAQGEACDLVVFNSITPNNDGVNDLWQISNIDLYPKNTVNIFNRWGTEIASINGYDNEKKCWPDKNSNDKLSAGTYFYVIIPGDGSRPKKGWIELITEK